MPPSNKDYGNQQTALRKILETMKKNFQTFKLASGEELGEHLYIAEIHFQNGEKFDSVQMSQTTKSLPRLEPLQSGGEMTQLDLSNQQSMDALNNESNVVSAERSNIDVTCSQEKGKTKRPKRVHNKRGVKIEIPLDDILQNSKKSIQAAADNLKVSRSTLKRVCRGYGVPSWPPCKKNMVGSFQPSESSPGVDHQQIPQLSFDLPFNQASTTVVHANAHNIAIEDANSVTIRAKYINDITIRFRLSLSSGLVELQQQIAKRLRLEARSYYVKYKDEEDHVILIACDDDLQDCISTYKLLGTSIVVLIDPK
ncbi:protein NLP7-like [Camellia sinensis]|nr:protein NLP7-like [Camellia sinensis]